MSPIELFHLRFFTYPASFYQLEVLLQTKVVNSIILIDKSETMTDD
jgi:hypothetical protein